MKSFLAFVFLFILLACANGPCRQQGKSEESVGQPMQANDKAATETSSAATQEAQDPNKVRIFKADGTKQCQQGKAIDLKVMEKELTKAGIKVLSSAKGSDGMMHTQVCGAATGKVNIYEISSADLAKAQKLGFKRLQP